jgi:hypothetical protein
MKLISSRSVRERRKRKETVRATTALIAPFSPSIFVRWRMANITENTNKRGKIILKY